MLAIIAVVPAILVAIIAILVYGTFALLFGSFALASSATRVAPKSIGLTLAVGFVAFVLAIAWFGNGPGAENTTARGIETAVKVLISILIASVAMIVAAGIAALNAKFSDGPEISGNDPMVTRQVQRDIDAGRWGLRTTSYSDDQHERAAAIGRDKARRDAKARADASTSLKNHNW